MQNHPCLFVPFVDKHSVERSPMKFIAHRGYSAAYPENTLPAVEAVFRHPACGTLVTGIEIDIRLTRDGRMAVFHDNTVRRGDQKLPVEAVTLAELQDAVKERFHGTPVPVLDDVLDSVGHRLELFIEIKDAGYDKNALMEALDASLRRYRPAGDVVLHSFSSQLMRMAVDRFAGRGLRFGVLVAKPAELAGFGPELLARMETVHPNWQGLVEQEETCAALGKPLNVWTVNRPSELAALRALKHAALIRAVITDDLALAGA